MDSFVLGEMKSQTNEMKTWEEMLELVWSQATTAQRVVTQHASD